MKTTLFVLFAFTLPFASLVEAETRGVIDDSDGFVNVRASESAEAAVIATVKTGESFMFECQKEAEWCKATLRSGKSGWMNRSRIRLHFTDKDLPERQKHPADSLTPATRRCVRSTSAPARGYPDESSMSSFAASSADNC